MASLLFMLCLGQAAALALVRLTPTRASRGLVAALAALVIVDGVPTMPIGVPAPAVNLASFDRRASVLELPIDSAFAETEALLHGMEHRLPLVNGYSGYIPPHYRPFQLAMADLDPEAFTALRRQRPMLVLLHEIVARDPGGYRKMIESIPGVELMGRTREGPYRLPSIEDRKPVTADQPLAVGADPRVGPILPIARVSANLRSENAEAVIDGDVGTRWEAPADQPLGEMRVTLVTAATVSRIELALGRHVEDYPRRLRVSVGPGGGGAVTPVWAGRTAGLLVAGALGDGRRAPIAIDLPPGTVAQEIVLTLIEGHHTFSWSIAELTILGTTPR